MIKANEHGLGSCGGLAVVEGGAGRQRQRGVEGGAADGNCLSDMPVAMKHETKGHGGRSSII